MFEVERHGVNEEVEEEEEEINQRRRLARGIDHQVVGYLRSIQYIEVSFVVMIRATGRRRRIAYWR